MKINSSMTALLLTGAAAAGAGYALAQGFLGPTLPNPVGTELMMVRPLTTTGNQAALEAVVNINQIRNATGYLLITTASVASGTVTISTATNELLVNVQPNTATWVLPGTSSVFDAEQFQFCNVSNTAFATNTGFVAAGAGTGINVGSTSQTSTSVTTLGSQTCLELAFDQATKQWYRIR